MSKHPCTTDFSARLLAVRGEILQADFAKMLNVNPNTLRAYEKGRAQPGLEFLAGVCEKFSVSPAWILTGSGPMHVGEADAMAAPQPEPAATAVAAGGAPWPLDGGRRAEAATDTAAVPADAPEFMVPSCERCARLEERLCSSEDERRDLARENRALWRENAELREENATMRERLRDKTGKRVVDSHTA